MGYERKIDPHGHRSLGRHGLRLSEAEIHARASADQARIRAEKLRWLEIEREKYRLPRRGRLIDDMPA